MESAPDPQWYFCPDHFLHICQTALSNQANAIILWIFVHVCSYLAALTAFLCVLSTAAKPLLIAFKRLHSAAPNSQNLRLLQPSSLQLFCSASWSHSAELQQRYAFRTGCIDELLNWQNEHRNHKQATKRNRTPRIYIYIYLKTSTWKSLLIHGGLYQRTLKQDVLKQRPSSLASRNIFVDCFENVRLVN